MGRRPFCVAIGRRQFWDHGHTIFAAYLYTNPFERAAICATGHYIVPTCLVQESEEMEQDMVPACANLVEYRVWKSEIGLDCHFGAQLTFDFGDLPDIVSAEEFPGFWRFPREVKALREKMAAEEQEDREKVEPKKKNVWKGRWNNAVARVAHVFMFAME